jgi:mannose-6-phosphate isomerase-like protein (cupin superfamily)
MSTPFVTLPAPASPAEGLSGFVFPMHEKEAPFGLIIFSVAPGACTEAHGHEIKEYWLITEGKGQVIYDSQSFDVKEGDFLYFEPHKTHQVINNSDAILKITSIDWYGTGTA